MQSVAEIAGTIVIGVIGLVLTYNYRRHMKLALSGDIVKAYARLWETTGVTTPDEERVIQPDELLEMSDRMYAWYFAGGQGMLMPSATRKLFFVVRKNLVCSVQELEPVGLRTSWDLLSAEEARSRRSCISSRQLSILRSRLKADLAVYLGEGMLRSLRPDESALLRGCGAGPTLRMRLRAPFVAPVRLKENRCQCGYCGSQGEPARSRRP